MSADEISRWALAWAVKNSVLTGEIGVFSGGAFVLIVTDFGEVLDSLRRTLKSADSAAIGRDSDVG